LRKIIKI